MALSFLSKEYDAETAQVFQELTQDSLRILLPVTAAITWGWAAAVLLFPEPKAAPTFGVLFLTLAVAWAGYRLSAKHLNLAIGVYLAALTVTVTTIALTFQHPAVLYLYIQVVLVAAMLTAP
ncbi:MAG TPA: hypothetical protein VMY80_17385, partial [Anaerolineae bacterium]|nr:hypothetical protein [Anaerolineae bacterium]